MQSKWEAVEHEMSALEGKLNDLYEVRQHRHPSHATHTCTLSERGSIEAYGGGHRRKSVGGGDGGVASCLPRTQHDLPEAEAYASTIGGGGADHGASAGGMMGGGRLLLAHHHHHHLDDNQVREASLILACMPLPAR